MPPLSDLVEDSRLLYRYTVESYHELIKAGAIEEGEPFELLNGQIIRSLRSTTGEDPMTVSPGHVWCVEALEELNPSLKRLGRHMRNQKPITLPPDNEPEPDGAIIRGRRDEPSTYDAGAISRKYDDARPRRATTAGARQRP